MGDSVVYAIKIALIVSATLAFVVAISTLVNLLTVFTVNTAFGEVLALISLYLPFNGGVVFTLLSSSITAILAFLVARRIYELLVRAQGNA